jgi:hypothetical protein
MHLLDRYALATASKITKPFIVKNFFPVDAEKYITIQNSSGMPGKCYDYFQDVINFLYDKLSSNGYKIVQIGGANDTPLLKVINLQGKTNINQTAYIINNSSLHLGNDSFAIHMASAFDIPTVSLYSVTSPEIAGPYWDNKKINLYPNNWRPSFNPNESPKRVNEIKIEDVVNACDKLLFNDNTIKFKTHYIGKRYNDTLIETLPNQIINQNFFAGHVLNIRFDYVESNDISHTMQNLAIRKCAIVTDKPVNVGAFMQFKENLSAIIYDVTNKVDIEFVKYLNDIGVKYICVFNKNKNTLVSVEDRRFELMEYCDVIEFNTVPEDIPSLEGGLKFKTKRILLANQKVYTSRAAQLQDLPIVDLDNLEQNISDIKDKEIFSEDLQYCYIYS